MDESGQEVMPIIRLFPQSIEPVGQPLVDFVVPVLDKATGTHNHSLQCSMIGFSES